MKHRGSALPPRGPSRAWLTAGYVGLAGFVVLEGTTRERGAASSLDASPDDGGTTRMIAAAYVLAALLPPLLGHRRQWPLPRQAGPLGLVAEPAGLGIRLWSMRALGRSYTRTLQTSTAQKLVDTGPYRFIRHPGYLGSLLAWTGCATASGSVRTVAAVGGLLAAAYRRRIQVEELLLRRELPGYAAYCRKGKRLVPFLW